MGANSMREAVTHVLAMAVGATLVALWADPQFIREMLLIFIEVLDEHGFAVAIATLLTLAGVGLVAYVVKALIDGKNQEIQRIADNRDQLLQNVLGGAAPPSSQTRGQQ